MNDALVLLNKRLQTEPQPFLLEVIGLKVHFPIRSGIFHRQTGTIRAVDGVNLKVKPGETLGLVGESGCGKSTLGRAALRLYNPTDGKIYFTGHDITREKPSKLAGFRRHAQMVFQDPYSSLNPRRTVGHILEQPLKLHKIGASTKQRIETVVSLLDRVGLGSWALKKYPHEFSGGQRQRIAIARAIATHPRLIVADEAVSALDVSVQSQILNLLKDLQKEQGMAYLFIAHDLAVVRHMANRIAVMYLGRVVEEAERDEIFQHPRHPYTKALLAAVPGPHRREKHVSLKGEPPSPANPPTGCAFHPRCPLAEERCRIERPELKNKGSTQVACHLVS